jgi:hypothetical protein
VVSVFRDFSRQERKIENKKLKIFYKILDERQPRRAVTRYNPAAKTHPVLDSITFAAVLTLPSRTCFVSASSVPAVRICCCVFSLFVFRKPLFINKSYRIYVFT